MQLVGEYEPSTWPDARDQVEQYERTDGVEGGTLFGYPVVILTTLGKQSGKLRKTPVMKVEHQGSYAVLASMGGAPVHPAWFHNLVAHPRAALQDGPIKREYNSRVLGGNERSSWWARAVEAFPAYADYQQATERVIPVVLLEPLD